MDHNFRAALGGFNRSDVVNYIEECSINHERALRQLREENARLREQLEQLQAAPPPEPPAPPAPPAPEPEPQPAPPVPTPSEDELAAYRRAEAAERNARRRAAALTAQVNEIVSRAAGQFDASRADVDAQMSDLSICLRQLNDTVAKLRMDLDDTARALASLDTQGG